MRLLKIALIIAGTASLAACRFSINFGTNPPPNNTGNVAVFGVTAYDPNGELYIAPSAFYARPNEIADTFANTINSRGWAVPVNNRDNAVTVTSLRSAEANNDALWFSGHGDVGYMELYWGRQLNHDPDQIAWGPGDQTHKYPGSLTGFPVQGRLKWIFAYSSQTVSAPPSRFPSNPELTADWRQAFGGNLHGLYGFSVRPGHCPNTIGSGYIGPDVTCDITVGAGNTFARRVAERMTGTNPQETIHSAWQNAAKDAGLTDKWSFWEDQNNFKDILSNDNAGVNYAPSGLLWYFDSVDTSGSYAGRAVAVGNETFTLQPASLTREPLDDSTLLNNAAPYFGNADTYTNDGSVSTATKAGTSTVHDLRTGALSYHGIAETNAFAFTQDDAYAAAVEAVQNGPGGMPSDAVLTETDVASQVDPSSGGATVLGYTFTWHHAGEPFGNDAIRVTVDDQQIRHRECTGGWDYWYDDFSGRPHRYCIEWTTYVTDNRNVSYMFRMWRTRSYGGGRHVLSVGQQSITAATAAASLSPNAVIYAYTSGNWTGQFDDPTDNAATPAWVFTLDDGSNVYVDAYTGQVLGTTK